MNKSIYPSVWNAWPYLVSKTKMNNMCVIQAFTYTAYIFEMLQLISRVFQQFSKLTQVFIYPSQEYGLTPYLS